VLFYQTQTTKRKVIFQRLIKSGDRIRRYSRILFREQPLRPERIVAKVHSNQTKALVDFNVEFAVVGKYKDCEGGLVLYGTALQN
jgi:hypothetical protein